MEFSKKGFKEDRIEMDLVFEEQFKILSKSYFREF